MRLRPARGIVLSGFLKHLLLSANVRRQLEILAGGGTMPVINGRIIRRLVIPLLSLDEQVRMIARIDALDETLVSLAEALVKLRQQKHGLMHDLLTGTVRVKIEQASVGNADG
jgi:type I restriction enzyme S subunit